ncbi:hypothetical protein UFOVP581_21 [uncultured Caudovirales phage]|uniref:Uncharacterized protein n=1 Tax=uncultured Caudovirales phage TaxID=2100421 RepID=A0A6J5PIE9_9CAUD|nr:hypothetical protein UFOVP581_21 [uncultured Caudovirales phage]
MTWAFDVTSNIPRITQSGTDTNLDAITTAINAVASVARSTAYTTTQMIKPLTGSKYWFRCSTAGTTAATSPDYSSVLTLGGTITDGTAVFTAFRAPDVQSLGTKSHYYMPDFRFNITGALTNENSQISYFTCWDIFLSAAGSYFKSGKFATDGITPLYDGLHFVTTRFTANNTDPGIVIQFGTLELIGGEVQTANAVSIASGSKILSYYTAWRNTRVIGGVSSNRFRAYSSTSIFRGCELYDMAYDLFVMPAEFSVVARDSEYVAQYVGGTYGGVDALFKAYALNNPDGSYDFDNYSGGYVELYNCSKGANLNVVTQLPDTRMCTPLFQEIRITAKDTTGAVVEGVRFKSTDSPADSPQKTFTVAGNLKTWDFRNALSYETTTNSSGIALSTPCLHVWYYTNALKKNLRFPSSTATYQGRAYNYKTGNVSIVLGSNSIQDVSAGEVGLDTETTVTEAVALANTNINVTTQNGGITIAVKGNSTYQDIWNSYRAYISQFANFGVADNWTCSGKNLNTVGASILVYPGVTLSGSTNITYAYADTFRALSLADTPYLFNAGGALQSAGILLTTTVLGVQDTYTGVGSITATYANLTGTSTTLELRGVTNGASAYVGNNATSSTIFFEANSTTDTKTIYFPPGSTGLNVLVARELYGYQRVQEVIPLSAGLVWYQFVDIEDVGISVPTKATVAAYTTLNNPDKVYDYTAYKRLEEAYIKLGQITIRDGSSLLITPYSMKVDNNAGSVYSIAGDVITIKSSSYEVGIKYTKTVTAPPDTITAHTNEVITCPIEDANGDSQLTISGGDGSYALWKIPTATATDDYATGTLLGTVGTGIYRFIGVTGFDIVGRDTNSNVRRRSSMAKGLWTQEFYVGSQIQLAQQPEVLDILTKVQVIQIDLTSVKGAGFTESTDSLEAISNNVELVKTKTDKMDFNAQNHIAANIHQLQAGAIASIQNGLAIETTSQSIETKVDEIKLIVDDNSLLLQNQQIINNGVKKSSLLIPHTQSTGV